MGRRFLQGVLVLGLVLASVQIQTPPAHAAPLDHTFPQSTASCSSSVRRGNPRSVYGSEGSYYGWAEFRRGTRGSCAGYQWIKVHFVNTLNTRDGLELTIYGEGDYDGLVTRLRTRTYAAGTYTNSEMKHATGPRWGLVEGLVYGPPGSYDVELGAGGVQGGELYAPAP